MPRKLKTYQTSLAFFDEAIAAPPMKAALEAWGTKTNLFHQGVAKEVDDPEVVPATMRKPGSFSGALSDLMGRSKNMPSCPHTCHVTR
jgi:hypothetical protein